MELISKDSDLWKSLTSDIKELIETGETVLQFVYDYRDKSGIVDYSFCVFSFAKAYEGFLKNLFLKMGFIKSHEFYGDDIRIGRILSPFFENESENVFYKMCNHPNNKSDLPQILWEAWKQSRNLVFHYYPHNFRKLNYDDAFKCVTRIIDAMNFALYACDKIQSAKK